MPATIHHFTIKSAEKQGVVLEVDGSVVKARIPKIGMTVFGVSGQDALKQALAAQELFVKSSENVRYRHGEDPKVRGHLEKNGKSGPGEMSITESTPVELLKLWEAGTVEWDDGEPKATGDIADKIEDTLGNDDSEGSLTLGTTNTAEFSEDEEPKPAVDSRPLPERDENGVALDGAVAYKEGITAADCPYSSETDDEDEYANFERWNQEWDDAADAAGEEEEGKTGSVVSSKYRTKYKEEGHPTHCGDWLAELLNNFCIGDKHTDLVTFERICDLNGVDTSKYKRDGVGWQGRIRMTGRNLLAKKVFAAGKINLPAMDEENPKRTVEAPADWIATQRYVKNKAE